MNSHTLSFFVVAVVVSGISGAPPATQPEASADGFEFPTRILGQPQLTAEEDKQEIDLAGWSQRQFFTTADLYLSAEDLEARRPTVAQVRARSTYIIGDKSFIAFQSVEHAERWYWIQVSSIVAAHYIVDRLDPPRQEGAPTGKLMPHHKVYFDLAGMFPRYGDLYLSSSAVRQGAPLAVSRPAAYQAVDGILFVRFYSHEDDHARWLINMSKVVALRPRNK